MTLTSVDLGVTNLKQHRASIEEDGKMLSSSNLTSYCPNVIATSPQPMNVESEFEFNFSQQTVQTHPIKQQKWDMMPSVMDRDNNNSSTECQEHNDGMSLAIDKTALEIANEEEVLKYYEAAFTALQQLNCRQVAKACIKVVGPRKQAKHPYNGGAKSKPEWWPLEVTHREPDHLKNLV
jgi:hypothetical protein